MSGGGGMSALTPLFDDLVLEDMQARWDDTPVCGWRAEGRCRAEATHSATCHRCGGFITVLCGEHATAAHQSRVVVRHDVCGNHAPLRDLLAVRPL